MVPRILTICLAATCIYFVACKCSQKADCPGFANEKMNRWLPYNDGQKLVYHSSSAPADTFSLKKENETGPHTITYSTGYPSRRADCIAEKSFYSLENDTAGRARFYLSMHTITGINGNTLDSTIRLYLRNRNFIFSIASDTAFARMYQSGSGGTNLYMQSAYFPSVTLAGKSFSNVIRVHSDTSLNKGAHLHQLYFARNIGLVAYAEYPTGKLWVKQ